MPVPDSTAERILQNIVKTMLATGDRVGETTGYNHAPTLVVRAPGISPKWFDDPSWEMAYWVVCPEERNIEMASFQFEGILEVFIVGAMAGRWSLKPWEQKGVTREETQQRIAYDIKKAILEDFKRGTDAYNSDLTDVKFSFTAYSNFAIVSTRWEFKYIYRRDQP